MRAVLAATRNGGDAPDRTHIDHRAICSGLAPRRGATALAYGDRGRMAPVSALQSLPCGLAAAAPELAQLRLAEEEPLVRTGIVAGAAKACRNPYFLKQVSFRLLESSYIENIFRKDAGEWTVSTERFCGFCRKIQRLPWPILPRK